MKFDRTLLQARDLQAANAGGTSDSYVVFGGQACVADESSSIVTCTLHPVSTPAPYSSVEQN